MVGMCRMNGFVMMRGSRLLACTLLAFALGGPATGSEHAAPTSLEAQSGAHVTGDSASAHRDEQPGLPLGFGAEFEQRLSAVTKLSIAERSDRQALTEFYAERQNEPVWTSRTSYTPAAEAVRAEIARANDWGLDASAFRIPALAAGRELTRTERAEAEIALSLAVLQYARYARGGRTDPLALSRNLDRQPPLLEPRKVIEAAVGTGAPDAHLRSLHPQDPQFERLRRLYVAARQTNPGEDDIAPGKSKGAKKRENSHSRVTREKLLVNMEQWRWMPEDLGRLYVWVNIPEYMVRVMKDGREIHSERVVVGRPSTATPIFSKQMKYIVFQPRWNVPDSIKTNELLPGLAAGDYSVLSRQGLRVSLRGRDIHPGSVDWSRVDVRKYYFYQPPGGGNALGQVKFLFPNKHDVYLHDTPNRGLFGSQARAFSHGCIRVRQPLKLAEVLLGEDQGYTPDRVKMTVQRGPQDNQINLQGNIPVHLTYFTVWVDDDGSAHTFPDVYSHEHRIAYGLAGKLHLIKREPESAPQTVVRSARRSWRETNERGTRSYDNVGGSTGGRGADPNWMRGVFRN